MVAHGSGIKWVQLRSNGEVAFEGEVIFHADGSVAMTPEGRMLRWSDYLCLACLTTNHWWVRRCSSCNSSQSSFLITVAQDPGQLPLSLEWWTPKTGPKESLSGLELGSTNK